jgi:uncharacterized protein YkwD
MESAANCRRALGVVKAAARARRRPGAVAGARRAAIALALAVGAALAPMTLARGGDRGLAAALDRAWAGRFGRALLHDATLDAVARWAASEALAGRSNRSAVRDRLWNMGVRDFEFVSPCVVAAPAEVDAALLGLFDDGAVTWPRLNAAGTARIQAGERTAACAVLTRRVASWAHAGQGTERWTLAEGLQSPRVYATRPDGGVDRRDGEPGDGVPALGWLLDVGVGTQEGAWLLEVVADGTAGPEVLAVWPAFSEAGRERAPSASARSRGIPDPNAQFPGEGPVAWDPYGGSSTDPRPDRPPPPDSAAWVLGGRAGPDRSPSADDARAAEEQLWALVRESRAARALAALRREPALNEAARRHAQDLARGEPFGHETSSGAALDRVAAAGMAVARAAENVAMAADVAEVHAALMASPAHRANILDPGLDVGGLGVLVRRDSRGRWSVVASELFARSADGGAIESLVQAARGQIASARRDRGIPEFLSRLRLDQIAQQAAADVVRSGATALSEERRAQVASDVRFAFLGVEHVAIDLVVAPSVDAVLRARHLLDAGFTEMGLGIERIDAAIGAHPRGSLVIVLVAVRRLEGAH